MMSFVQATSTAWFRLDLMGQLVVLDGNAFAIHLFNESGCDWRLGGDLRPLFEKVIAFLASLVAVGVRCTLLFDGAKEVGKAGTTKARMVERSKAAKCLMKLGVETSMCWTVLPPGVVECVMDAAAHCDLPHVTVMVAVWEADRQVARVAVRDQAAAVVSNDSDFAVFPGVPFLPLANLVVGRECCYGMACSAASVAASMKLPVQLLPTLAVMVGTDFCDLGDGFMDSVLAYLRRTQGKRLTLSSYVLVSLLSRRRQLLHDNVRCCPFHF